MSDEKPMEFTEASLYADDLLQGYVGLKTNASHRSFIDIEPNRSIRTDYNRGDYDYFRPLEATAHGIKSKIKSSINAYNDVGIVKNVIDLMGDFASQGITVVHPDKRIQTFYRSWWKQVRGYDRCERFLNQLYKTGNVAIKRSYAKLGKRNEIYMAKGKPEDIKPEKLKVTKGRIPWKYTILNPLVLDIKGGSAACFVGQTQLQMTISEDVVRELMKEENKALLAKLPLNIRKSMENGTRKIDLNMDDVRVFYYKKEDYEIWAKPMIHAILDDISMFEKFKLGDLSALDGVISNIRLWSLGDLEHKLMPTRAAIDKLRDIIASNTGGGVMDLIWGPELKFTESNTQAYRFLGEEKYKPVLNSIYAGLGIPQTLTGDASGSGYTNNFISLKTLIDRLQYGRAILDEFWCKELELVQKSMGFDKPAKLHYDFMISSDENTVRNLWKELADRNIISVETLRERINEDNEIEEARIKNEMKARKTKKMPVQADPYHNANYDNEFIKTSINSGELSITDILEDIKPSNPGLKKDKMMMDMKMKQKPPAEKKGRPPFSQDKQPRKQRTTLPKTKAWTNYILWANCAQKSISEILDEPLLKYYDKKNLRQLSNTESKELEHLKFNILTKIEPLTPINSDLVVGILKGISPVSPSIFSLAQELNSNFFEKMGRLPTLDESRQLNSFAIILEFFSKNDESE